MAKYILMVGLLSFAFLAVAQNFEQQIPQQLFQEMQEIELGNLDQQFNTQRLQAGYPLLELEIPEQYSGHDRDRILSLLSEIKQICPDCSTGGTIGGGVITGGNSGGGGSPLFPIDLGGGGGLNATVTITRAEYNNLKLKAALYDSILSNNGEDQ